MQTLGLACSLWSLHRFPAAACWGVHFWATPWGAQVCKTAVCAESWYPHGEMGGKTQTN